LPRESSTSCPMMAAMFVIQRYRPCLDLSTKSVNRRSPKRRA
jgi:hypothetical protein